jgi:hypothetical protein
MNGSLFDKLVMLWSGQENTIKKQLFDLEVKDQGSTKVITVRDTPPYGHAHTNYLPMKFCWIYLNYLTLSGTLIFDLKIK